MSSKPFLSICIPAYNKSDRLKKNITSLLNACDDEIEIVVVDNVSSENLKAVCKGFKDPRISYYRNEKPIVANANWFRSIRLAKGQWAMLLMDRDLINGKGMPAVIEELKKNSACGAARIYFHIGGGDEIYAKNSRIENCKYYPAREIETILAVNRIQHPSGKIYNRDFLTLSEAYENAVAQNPRNFDQLYIIYEPAWNNGFLSIKTTDMICIPTNKYMKSYKSGWKASLPNNAKVSNYYTPNGFMLDKRENLEEMLRLDLSLEEKKRLCVQAYNGFMKRGFISMISIPKSDLTWSHYDEKYKYRTGKERNRIASEFCEHYKESVRMLLGNNAEDVLAKIKPIRVNWLMYMKPTVRAMKSAIAEKFQSLGFSL